MKYSEYNMTLYIEILDSIKSEKVRKLKLYLITIYFVN